jgi:hypothetical protein
VIKRNEPQGSDEEWIRIPEQNRPTDKRGHKGDVEELRVAPCHRGPRLSRIDPVAAARRREDEDNNVQLHGPISKLGRSARKV